MEVMERKEEVMVQIKWIKYGISLMLARQGVGKPWPMDQVIPCQFS
jgi:hypothetical protein